MTGDGLYSEDPALQMLGPIGAANCHSYHSHLYTCASQDQFVVKAPSHTTHLRLVLDQNGLQHSLSHSAVP